MNKFYPNIAEMLSRKKCVVSFDIYDTLVKRDVPHPAMVFDLIAEEYERNCGEKLLFRDIRTIAEREARQAHPGREVTLDEIYGYIDLPSKEELKEIEKRLELWVTKPNYPVVDFYHQCIKSGKRVILISDMYLPRELIEEILKKCGLTGYEKLYLSSEIGVEKKTGKLYDYVLNDLGLPSYTIIHFGDRKKTDNIIPRLRGISSFYVPPCIKSTEFLDRQTLRESCDSLFWFVNNNLPKYKDEDELFRWGYETLGPLLMGFCMWVHAKVKENDVDRVFFLARDMNLVYKYYSMLYPNEKTYYLEVSRRSLREAYILERGKLEYIFDTMTRKPYTVNDILDVLTISWNELSLVLDCKTLCIEPDSIIPSASQIPAWFEVFGEAVMKLLSQRDNTVKRYLDQFGLFSDTSDCRCYNDV